MSSFSLGRGIVRVMISVALIGVFLVIFGISDLIADANGSHEDIEKFGINDFRSGDVVKADINETWGCAIEETETTMVLGFIPTSKHTSALYYVVPYYENVDDYFPEKIVLYRTGNTTQQEMLEKIFDETMDWYMGNTSGITTHLEVERAVVKEITGEEDRLLKEYLYDYCQAAYDASDSTAAYQKFTSVLVPYVVRYNANDGSLVTVLGFILLAVDALVLILVLAKNRQNDVPQFTYVGSNTGNAANYAPPASRDMPYNSAAERNMPPVQQPMNSTSYSSPSLPGNYGAPERPMPPIQPQQNIGNPLDDANFGRPNAGGSTFGRRPETTTITGDTMDAVDPHSYENVDLTNGGIDLDERSWGNRNAVMPKNGDLPVINPHGHNSSAMFGDVVPEQPEEPVPHEDIAIQPSKPLTSQDNLAADVQVEPTDPSMRNMFKSGGSLMDEVDPYTETNVDISNGGIEKEAPEELQPEKITEINKIPAPTSSFDLQWDQINEAVQQPSEPDTADPWASVNAAVQQEIEEAKSDPWASVSKDDSNDTVF